MSMDKRGSTSAEMPKPKDPLAYLVVEIPEKPSTADSVEVRYGVGGIDVTEFIPRQLGVIGLMGKNARNKPIR